MLGPFKSKLSKPGKPKSLITFVADRKGRNMRYTIDSTKIHRELGWLTETKFSDGPAIRGKTYRAFPWHDTDTVLNEIIS